MRRTLKSRFLLSTIIGGAVAASSMTAMAQSSDDDEIIVTGSRIAQQDYTSNSPIATVDAEQFSRTFTINTENLLNTLPQTVPGLDRTSNNPGNGSATVDLRGLGASRTLVLVNGARMVPFGQNGVVDLNTIPTSLIENVEVLTGGASSVYGADAVAGVVNFILKDDFEGAEANIGYNISQEGDAGLFNADATFGANLDDGRGNAVVNVSYTKRDSVLQGDRDFSTVALFNDGSGGLEPGGSSGVPGTSIFNGGFGSTTSCAVPLGARAADGTLIPCPTASLTTNAGPFPNTGAIFGTDGSARDFVLSGDVNDFYNYAPVNFLQLPQERFTITALADYEVSDNLELYTRASFAQNRVDSQLAPTPIFQTSTFSLDNNPFITAASQAALSGNNTNQLGIGDRISRVLADTTSAFSPTPRNLDENGNPIIAGQDGFIAQNLCLNCVFDSNGDGFNDVAPLLDTDGDGIADTATALIRRRVEEAGPRQTIDINDAMQITLGARGDITDNWNYDVYFQHGRTVRSQTQNGNLNRGRFTQALLLADADGDGNVDLDAAGNPTCADPSQNGGTATGCVPMNVFGEGNISPEAAAFISTATAATSEFKQTVIQGNISGNLGDFSLTEQPIGIALGAEYIDTSGDFRPSQDTAVGTVAGFNGAPPSGGEFDVYSVYGEAAIPLLSGLPFAERVVLDIAGRYSDYSISGSVEAYKIGGEWAVNDQVRFRGNYNRAVRAPNIAELFAPVAENFPGAVDPCSAAGDPSSTVAAICTATGVPASAVGSAAINTISGQVRTLAGGNTGLTPEVADTYTFGVVVEPSMIEGLSLSVDYYDISIAEAIAAFGGGANNVLNTCYNNAEFGGAGSDFCNVITRRADGSIDNISLQARNVASTEVAGIDVSARYGFEAGDYGNVRLSYLGTYNLRNEFTAFLGDTVITCDGEFGTTCGEPDPKYRHRVTASLDNDTWGVQTVWRMIGSVDDDAGAGVNSVDNISSRNYFDASASKDIGDRFTLSVGVNNVFDKNPPIIGDNDEQANTYPATYDVYGRSFFANAKVSF